MPRLTRRSLASKEEEQPTPAKNKRGSKKQPVEEPVAVDEEPVVKSTKSARDKAKETSKGNARTPSRGRGKKEESEEEEMEEDAEQSPTPKRGGRGGKGKKEEPEPKKVAPAPKRGSRGRGKQEEEEDDELTSPPAKKPARGGRAKKQQEEVAPSAKKLSRSSRAKKNEQPEPEEGEEEEEEEKEDEEVEEKPARGGRKKQQEEVVHSAKKPSRSSRGKKNEQPESEEEEEEKKGDQEVEEKPASASKKPAAKGRGGKRSGGHANKQETEEAESVEKEEKVEEEIKLKESPAPKGRQSRSSRGSQPTPTPPASKGRSSRGKKNDNVDEVRAPVESSPPAIDSDSGLEKPDASVVEDSVQQSKEEEEKGEENETPTPAEKVETSQDSKQDNEIVMEDQTDEAATEHTEVGAPTDDIKRKRKLDDIEGDAQEEDSASKKTKTEDNEADVAADYVIVNKDEVPAADSQEIQDSLPPVVEVKDKTPEAPKKEDSVISVPADAAADVNNSRTIMAAPTLVPLTEAELAKQYNPTVRDRDENSSMMVEVGSEAASDVGSISRNFDASEVAAMDVTGNAEEPEAATENTSKTEDSENNSKIDEIELPKDNSSNAVNSNSVNDDAQSESIVAPIENSSVPVQSEPISPPAPSSLTNQNPASIPVPPQPAPVPDVQLNSIPLPSNTNCTTDSTPPVVDEPPPPPPSQTSIPVPTSIPSHPPVVTQNGNGQSAPLFTSTPAKKPVVLDSSYVPSSPSITERKVISNLQFPIELMDPAMWFSVASYNILADCHLRRYDYSYTESQYLDLTYRHTVFLKEFDYLDSDILCLQEVDTDYYHNVLEPALKSRGYQGVFMKRTQDWYAEGEATFVKTSKFEVLNHEGISLRDLAYKEIEMAGLSGDVARAAKKYVDRADVVLLCSLKSKKTGKNLTVANIHVLFDPKAPDVQCIQVASAVKELVSKAGSDLNPYIICGDFNSEATSPGYQLAKDGYLSDEHIRQLQNIQSMDNTEGSSKSIIHYLWKAFQHTSSNLKSAYETCVGKEPEVTSLNGLVRACLDYIFYSSSTMYAVNVLETLDPKVVDASGGMPSKDIPSDHLSMKAVFRLKD